MVTSKSGKFNQKGKISYSYDVSWDTTAALPDVLDTYTIQKASMDRNRWQLDVLSVADEKKLEAMLNYNQTNYEEPYIVVGKGSILSAIRGEVGKNINMPIIICQIRM